MEKNQKLTKTSPVPELTEDQQVELMNCVKESPIGNREFSSGAHRDSGVGKPRPSLLPQAEMERVMYRYLSGAEKYGENNWMKGMPLSVYYDSATRHLQEWFAGDTNEDHAAAAVWNILCAMWTEKNQHAILSTTGEKLDDREKYPRS